MCIARIYICIVILLTKDTNCALIMASRIRFHSYVHTAQCTANQPKILESVTDPEGQSYKTFDFQIHITLLFFVKSYHPTYTLAGYDLTSSLLSAKWRRH
jgi:hypothetical protein